MSAAKSIESCARFDYALSAYADGELDPDHALDLESHLVQCPPCFEQVKLLRSLRGSLRRAKPAACPDVLRARVAAAMAHEHARGAAREAAQAAQAADARPRLVHKGYAAALAVAAGVVFMVGVTRQRTVAPADMAKVDTKLDVDVARGESVEVLLDDLVMQHAQPLPPETTDPADLPRFDPFVGVPVRRPEFQSMHANFMGARVHTMRNRRAALLQYVVKGNHRVTVYLFNSRAVPVQKAQPILKARVVRERPVYVGKINGYSVVAAEHSGVGYALASDLGDDLSTQLVLAAMQ
ncbi:anti-sigma factor family protein [Sorangium sp. So ce887]|uniref:anti-sigma factor family protein n=1 Tax=Sorangium sp. So ce887 TaxID=3133324 RepID=UPI003F5DBCCB